MKDQNHYLLQLLHGQTTSTVALLNFGLELHPLGLFRSSLLVMRVEQVTNLSLEIVETGFQIQEDLLLNFCRLVVSPGARVESQMTTSEAKKTKEVAKLRIHVERAINRIRFFRILKGTIPVTMMQHVDDITLTCAALCNLKSKLIKTKAKNSQE